MNFFPLAKVIFVLTLLTVAGQALPARLQAQVMVEVANQSGAQAYICFSYHDIISDSRVTRGWWPVAAHSTIDIRVNTNKPELAWYAYNSKGKSWGGREGAPDADRRHVVRENFLVKEGWKPRGKEHLMINLKKEKTANGRLRLILTP